MFRRFRDPALRIAAVYFTVALLAVVVADLLVHRVTPSHEVEDLVGVFKGVGFVVVTTALLYVGIRQALRSMTEARETAEANEDRFRALVSSIDDLVFMTDREQRFTELVGPATTPTHRERFLGRTAIEIFGSEVGRAYLRLGERVLRGESMYIDWFRETMPIAFPVRGEVTSMRIALAPLRDAGGEIAGIIGVGRDTSLLHDLERERAQAESHISFLVNYDPLTGLPNRSLLESRLTEAIAVADRDSRPVAVYMLNIDGFKDINDSLGYEVGDELLRAVATRLRTLLGPRDSLARASGDEFVIVTNARRSREEIEAYAEEILGAFSTSLHGAGQDIYLTASMGIALYPQDGANPDLLLRAADTAMYEAKAQRGASYSFFHGGLAEAARERLALANDLRRALEQGELSVAYQPIVDARSGHVLAFEALARWHSPTRGIVPPSTFIPIAERSGLADDVGRFVRIEGYRWLRRCQAAGFEELQLEVNVSPYHFRRGTIARLLEEVRETGIDPRHVVLELTENALVEARGPVERMLGELREHGFGLAVDDFGTGYSSLTYLARLPVTVLKVAQEFVRGYEQEGHRVVIETAVEFGRRLGYQTIAEGVEQEREAEYLRGVGVDAFQGFLYGRPATGDEAFEWLQGHRSG